MGGECLGKVVEPRPLELLSVLTMGGGVNSRVGMPISDSLDAHGGDLAAFPANVDRPFPMETQLMENARSRSLTSFICLLVSSSRHTSSFSEHMTALLSSMATAQQ